MTGICGIYSEGEEYSEKDVRRMMKPLTRDGKKLNIVSDDKIIIGIRSSSEYKTEFDDVILAVKGNIYNLSEISGISRKNLEDRSTEEIIAETFRKKGSKIFGKTRGDYSLVLWDSKEENLHVSKSLVNNKNIYYKSGNTMFFATEMKSLLQLEEISPVISRKSLSNYLKFGHIPSPHTPFSNINRLDEGRNIVFSKGKAVSHGEKYEPRNKPEIDNLDEACRKLEEALSTSIDERLNHTEEPSLMLSGGIDSSMLAYYIKKQTDKPLQTYTVGLNKDLKYAKEMSEFFDTEHTERLVDDEEFLNSVPQVLWWREYPSKDPGVSPLFHIKDIVDTKNILWGQGAEESYMGRKDYLAIRYLNKFSLIQKMAKMVPSNRELNNKTRLHRLYNLSRAETEEEQFMIFRENMTETRNSPFEKDILDEDFGRIRGPENIEDRCKRYGWITLTNGFLSDTFPAPNLNLMSPFLDRNVIDLGYRISPRIHLKDRKPRFVIRKLMEKKVPDNIVNRGRDSWSHQAGDIAQDHKEIFVRVINRLKDRNILTDNAEKLLESNYNTNRKLWQLFNLEIFLEIFKDQKYSKEPPKLEEFL